MNKLRSEINNDYKWQLEDMFATLEDWHAGHDTLQPLLDEISTLKGTLDQSPETLLKCLELQDVLNKNLETLFVFAHMKSHEDLSNTTTQKIADKATSLSIKANATLSFIIPEILAISTEQLENFINSNDKLKFYKKYLDNITRQKSHVLSESLEELLANTNELSNAPQNIYTMFTNTDFKFEPAQDSNGNLHPISLGNYISYQISKDRVLRKNSYENFYKTYLSNKNTLATIYNSSVKGDVFYSNTKKYNSALEAALDVNNIDIAVYNQLLDTVHDNLGLLHEYMSIRKDALGVDTLHCYDLYPPIVDEPGTKITFEEAKEIILKALEPLGEEYISLLKKGFDEKWIDVYENKGKKSGAYSWGAYTHHPYVLMNYTDTINDMFTLAHEMGHALHSYYSNTTQSYRYAKYPIFLAEVASTVNEALLMDYLLKNTEEPAKKSYLLNHYMEKFRGTFFRQTLFAEFEKITHDEVENGNSLTVDQLCEIYHDLNRKYYGPDIDLDEQIDIEWARIPHFYRAFYVYQYATGFSSAVALSQKILTEGQPAVDQYLNFLKAGKSDYPVEILKNAGVDMTTPAPIQNALNVFSELIEHFKK